MIFIELIVFLLILLSAISMERKIRERVHIEKTKGRYKPVNTVHRWLKRTLIAACFIQLACIYGMEV